MAGLNHVQKVTDLVGERLLLREHVADDGPIIDRYASRKIFWRFLGLGELQPGSGSGFIERVLKEQAERPRLEYNLAILLKSEQRLIGSARVGITEAKDKRGTLGYALDPGQWGQGYATEAVALVLGLGFNTLGLHRIFATCDARNTASSRIMEKLGMVREGRLRENEYVEGRWHDSLLYAMLEQDFRGGR